MDFQKKFEFTVNGAKLEFTRPPFVNRVILFTEDVPKGKITSKLRLQQEREETVDGMPGTYSHEEKYRAQEMPKNVKEVVKKANEMDELTCTAKVGKNEDGHMFILDEDIETLEARLLQDDRDE